MNYFLVIGILACVAGCYSANVTANECSSDKILAAAARCLDASGLRAEFIRFQTNITTAQDLKQACEHPQKYQPVLNCIYNVTAPCVADTTYNMHFQQALQDNLIYCSDPKVSFECLAEYVRNKSALESCINYRRDLTNAASRSSQESMCYGRKLIIQCFGELIKPCDAYTAAAIGSKLMLASPTVCYFYKDFTN